MPAGSMAKLRAGFMLMPERGDSNVMIQHRDEAGGKASKTRQPARIRDIQDDRDQQERDRDFAPKGTLAALARAGIAKFTGGGPAGRQSR